MKSFFKSDFFAGNRQKLRELVGDDVPIIVAANGMLQKGADTAYPFSQDANFWYLTGIDEPDLVLVMDSDKEYLIVPARSAVRAAFDGTPQADALQKRSGIKNIYDSVVGWEILAKRLVKLKRAATLNVPPSYVERYGLYTNPARANLIDKLKSRNAEIQILEINQQLAKLRMVKQAPEIKAIQSAIDITIDTIQEVIETANLKSYTHEYQIEAEIRRGYRSRGAQGDAFEPIIASGKNAVTLHYVANNDAIKPGELLLIDTGAEVEHYAADITRTLSLNKATRRQQQIYQAVLKVQQFAKSLLKPGITLKDYEGQIEHFMGECLRELGLIEDDSHESIRKYYPHASSHFLGLNTHDVGEYDSPLSAGVVVTVEPGIYIPREGIGVRIEDDVLVTDSGVKVLSDKLPAALS